MSGPIFSIIDCLWWGFNCTYDGESSKAGTCLLTHHYEIFTTHYVFTDSEPIQFSKRLWLRSLWTKCRLRRHWEQVNRKARAMLLRITTPVRRSASPSYRTLSLFEIFLIDRQQDRNGSIVYAWMFANFQVVSSAALSLPINCPLIFQLLL